MKVRVDGEELELRTVWMEDGVVKMIDQRLLPHRFRILETKTHVETAQAIKDMAVRGAGAIGVAAAYAVAQAALHYRGRDLQGFMGFMEDAAEVVRNTRPTAVNLFHAVDRVLQAVRRGSTVEECRNLAVEEAERIADEDAEASRRIGELGSQLIQEGYRILTHCNAGALAFVDYGTALSPIRVAHRQGKRVFVYVDETRPRCQGSRLTAWELLQEGIPHAVIADNAAGLLMMRGEIDMVIVGADRIAMNGDVANKIGTYEKAVLAKENGVPFYVAAPTTTIDPSCPSGDRIPIEERSPLEVLTAWGVDEDGVVRRVRLAPKDSDAFNPAFDVTPAKYITAIITEKGIIRQPLGENIPTTLKKI